MFCEGSQLWKSVILLCSDGFEKREVMTSLRSKKYNVTRTFPQGSKLFSAAATSVRFLPQFHQTGLSKLLKLQESLRQNKRGKIQKKHGLCSLTTKLYPGTGQD